MKYNIGDKLICKKDLMLNSKIFAANIGDVVIVYNVSIDYYVILNKKIRYGLLSNELIEYFETLPEKRKRIIKDYV